mgnify:CR=1 FL=1
MSRVCSFFFCDSRLVMGPKISFWVFVFCCSCFEFWLEMENWLLGFTGRKQECQMPTNGSSGSVCRNASVDGFRLFQRLRLSKNQNILPGGDRRTAAGRSTVFHVARRISHRVGFPNADERFLRVPAENRNPKCRRTVPPGQGVSIKEFYV